MRNKRKVLAIILSMLMAVQTPAMASELVVEEVSVQEENSAEVIAIEEQVPEEAAGEVPEEVSEEISEAISEEPFQAGELVEELTEDNILPEDPFEEELVEEPAGIITEEEPAEAIDNALSGQEDLLEGDDPELVGAGSGQCGDNVRWTLSKDGVLNITGSGSMWDANWDYDTKTASASWLPPKEEIVTVNIRTGVTKVGELIFWHCTSLKSVTIGNSVSCIDAYAFQGCTSLTSVTIPDSVTAIKTGAFESCSSLTSVIIPDGVTSIEQRTFSGCSSLISVSIPDSVTSLGADAFFECGSLTSVTLPDNVTSIETGAFERCTSLKSINIPGNVTNIEPLAFQDCSSLTSVTIPDSVEALYDNTFAYCRSLKSVKLPDSLTYIGWCAFMECDSLTDVTIGNEVKCIDNYAFQNCDALSKVTIGNSVTSIGEYAFEKCISLTSITLPNSVTSIGDFAFSDCCSLKKVKLGDGLTSIGYGAFYLCNKITNVTIPEKVSIINDCAFGNCYSLNTVIFNGDAPDFVPKLNNVSIAFNSVTATVFYPVDNPTWTEEVRLRYGGNLKWIPLRNNGRIGFYDVTNPADFFYNPIYWAVDNGIATGYSDNTFRPNNLCHRAAVVTFLWRMAGKPDEGISTAFSDMTGNDDFDRAITWASNHGITTGYKDGTFRPYNPCHRAAIVTFLWRYANKPEPSASARFSDMTKNVEFDKAIAWAAENNITTGYKDGTFRPYNSCLRLAVVTFLYRYAHL